jgi:hypothetical protein
MLLHCNCRVINDDPSRIYRVFTKSLLVFERSYNDNLWGHRNGTGAIL